MLLDLNVKHDVRRYDRQLPGYVWESRHSWTLFDTFWGKWERGAIQYYNAVQTRFYQTALTPYTDEEAIALIKNIQDWASLIVPDIDTLCERYVQQVADLKLVQKIMAVESEDVTTLWTIIQAPPFDDSLREPIYEAQLEILRELRGNMALDFYVLNVSEFHDPDQLPNFLPSNAKLLWRR